MGYTWGTSLTSDDGFFLLSGNVDDEFLEYSLLDGILFRDGVSAKLTEARRTIVERDAENACPIAMRIDVVDEQGRTAHIEGTNVNRFIVNLYPEPARLGVPDPLDDGRHRPRRRGRGQLGHPRLPPLLPIAARRYAVTTAVNVLDPEFYVDPWDSYRWLRDEAPVFWDAVQQLWVISRYEDVVAVERDGARYSSSKGSRPHIDQSADESMINMDDPAHQAQRNLIARRFTPTRRPHPRGSRSEDRDGDPRRGRPAMASARRSRPSPRGCPR